ncbi:MAG: protein-N(pi)-phosphohistidine--sugar phosphotransferase, partial [Clostridiales bacterium]|nr:protein-N(pi)-phosphohistidine--sugar phosphotransferase [Clostridiales bacterium]
DGKPVEKRRVGTDGKPVENRPEEPARGRWKAGTMKIYFVCDAGMGSSAMASALFKRKLKAEAIEGMEVFHVSADRIPGDADVVVCQQGFASSLPHTGLPCFAVENLTDMDAYTELLEWLKGDG